MFDLIGDIHGHAGPLERLLSELHYERKGSGYQHPDGRRVIFLGDYIDRGPDIPRTLEIVRSMVESRNAIALLGNHEWNALAYHFPDPEFKGSYLRPRCKRTTKQHLETLEQLSPALLDEYLQWFRSLPFFYDSEQLRAVHAVWDPSSIQLLQEMKIDETGITDEFLISASREDHPYFQLIETLLKGKEVELPDGVKYPDKEGHMRSKIRTRWYMHASEITYRDFAFPAVPGVPDLMIEEGALENHLTYPADAPPLFIGHYWLRDREPQPLAENVACIDYSIAKGGYLCAYRWSGESAINQENFVVFRP